MSAALRGSLAATVLGLALLSCARSDRIVIVAFGDSTTHWTGPTTNWVRLLRERKLTFGQHEVELVDAGVASDTTELARTRFGWDVLRRRPDVTVIQFGINDAFVFVNADPPATGPRVPVERYEENLRYFVAALREQGSEVVLMTPNPLRWTDSTRERFGAPPYDATDPRGMNVLLDDYAAAVRRVAAEDRVDLVDVHRLLEESAAGGGPGVAELLTDGVHPNDRAHRIIADALEAPISRAVERATGVRCSPQASDARATPSGPYAIQSVHRGAFDAITE